MKNKKNALLLFCLFAIFYSLYFYLGFLLSQTKAFSGFNILFEYDTPRVIGDIASFSSNHGRTSIHPIYVLLVNPLGCSLSYLIHSKLLAAVIINSFFGAASVVLAFIFFRIFSRNYFDSLLLSGIFGLSMSQLITGAVPETFSLAILSLMITYILFLVDSEKKNLHFRLWVLAGIFSLGITTTNFMQTLICFISITICLPKDNTKKLFNLINIFIFVATVVFAVGLLAIIQKMIYRSATLFFLPKSFGEEICRLSPFIILHPFQMITQVFKHFFFVNVIGPLPFLHTTGRIIPSIHFYDSWNYLLVGWLGTILWLGFLCVGVFKNLRENKEKHLFFTGILSCLLFNMILHSFYGIIKERPELFIYTSHFTFLVLIYLSNYAPLKKVPVRICLVVLLLLVGSNNLIIMSKIINIYK